jgi:hypothetical protein
MDKAALEHLLSSYNWWMGVSTVAVALGILGEYVAHFIFEKEARRNRLEMAISILFGVFVLGGVVGEYIFGSKLSEVSEQLQRIADTDVAQSNRDAAAARKDAEVARKQSADTYERAAKAEQHAAQENERAARALEAAEVARKNAEGFQLQIAQANERAANAERETARLTEKLADRTLTDAQVADIAAIVKPFAGQEVEIVPYWQDKESMAIANRILAALNLGGWKYLKPTAFSALMGGVTGVNVNVHPEAYVRTRQAAAALASARNAQRIVSDLVNKNDPGHPDNKITLTIGAKR